jgi:hypothetical protein
MRWSDDINVGPYLPFTHQSASDLAFC